MHDPPISYNSLRQQEIMLIEYLKEIRSQQRSSNYLLTYNPAIHHEILQTVASVRSNDKCLQVFNTILYFHNRYRDIYPTEQFIADRVGCSRRTVIRALSKLREWGWLWTDARFNDSLIFYINPFFTVEKVRIYLRGVFNAFNYLMLAQLFIPINAAGAISKESVTLLYSSEVIIIEKTIRDPYKRHHITSYLKDTLKKGSIMPNRLVVSEVMKVMELSESQLLVLDQYNDSQIKRALERTVKKQPDRAEPYFMSVLKSVQQEDVKKGNVNVKVESSVQDQIAIRKALNDRYTLAEIEHCEKILALFDRICNEDPVEANLIALGKPSKRWSLSWGTPASFETRLKKHRGE